MQQLNMAALGQKYCVTIIRYREFKFSLITAAQTTKVHLRSGTRVLFIEKSKN